MPELDGTSLLAIASFAALVVAWLIAPTAPAVAERKPLPATAAA